MGQQHIQTRIPDKLADRIEEYQKSDDFMNDSEAIRQLLRSGLEAEQEPDTEPEPIPDGGYLRRSDHPWIDPLVEFGYQTATVALWILGLSVLAFAIPSGAIQWYGADLSGQTLALFLSFVTLGLAGSVTMLASSVLAMLALEYLMHPSEAPIRRYFYNRNSEDGEVIA